MTLIILDCCISLKPKFMTILTYFRLPISIRLKFWFFVVSFCLKSPPVFDKNIQSCVGEIAGRGPEVGKVCVYLVLPGGDALDT